MIICAPNAHIDSIVKILCIANHKSFVQFLKVLVYHYLFNIGNIFFDGMKLFSCSFFCPRIHPWNLKIHMNFIFGIPITKWWWVPHLIYNIFKFISDVCNHLKHGNFCFLFEITADIKSANSSSKTTCCWSYTYFPTWGCCKTSSCIPGIRNLFYFCVNLPTS